MQKLKLLLATLLAIISVSSMNAQSNPVPYAVLTNDGTTLTFYYDENKPTGAFGMSWGYGFPEWTDDGIGNKITTVTFDDSFDGYKKLSSAYAMFYNMSALTTINHLEYLHTDNVTDMARMFYYCSSLTSLDLSNFNTGNVTQMNEMFRGCSNLETIYCTEDANWSEVTHSDNMFSNCSKLSGKYGDDEFAFDSNNAGGTYAKVFKGGTEGGYFTSITEKRRKAYAVVSNDGTTLTFYYNENKPTGAFGMSWGYGYPSWTNNSGNNITTTVTFDASFDDYTELSSAYAMFYNMSALTTINHLEYLHTDNVTDMTRMFYYCSSLTSLDLSNFNTGNVTQMNEMFRGCSNLETIYCAENANWSEVTYSDNMFSNCSKLSGKWGGIEFAFDSNKVGGTYAKVYDGTNEGYFTSITERQKQAYAVVSNNGATLTFYYDNQKTNWMDNTNVTVHDIPWKCDDEEDVPSWTDYDRQKIIDITTAVFDASFANYHGLTATKDMFGNLKKLEKIENLDFLNTENVTNMKYMFWGCEKLTILDVSNFNTTKVENMNQMFATCQNLETIFCAEDANWSGVEGRDCFEMLYFCPKLSGKSGDKIFAFDYDKVDGTYARVYTGDDEEGGYFTYIGNINSQSVTLNNKGYATYASIFPMDFTNVEGYTTWQITGVKDETITFEQITGSVAAGTGVLLMGEASANITINFSTYGDDISSTNLLKGITKILYIFSDEYYGLSGNQFVPVSGGDVPAGKALLPADKVQNVKSLNLVFNDETGIIETRTVNDEQATSIFNLTGQRLEKPQRGINIVNGKKVLVK